MITSEAVIDDYDATSLDARHSDAYSHNQPCDLVRLATAMIPLVDYTEPHLQLALGFETLAAIA